MGRKEKRIDVRKEFQCDITFEGSFDSIRESLDSYEKENPGYDLSFDHHYAYSEYDEDSYILYGYRKETDEEYEARLAKNKVARENAKAKRKALIEKLKADEKALYEKLKEKFEG